MLTLLMKFQQLSLSSSRHTCVHTPMDHLFHSHPAKVSPPTLFILQRTFRVPLENLKNLSLSLGCLSQKEGKKKRKMLYARWKILLNISEVVCVWHFPHTFRGVKSNMMYKFTKRNSFKYTQLGYRFSHTLFRLLLVHV